MADHVSADVRRRIMESVQTKDTGPEMLVRRMLHALGYRYRLHRKDLPGSPDLVFPRLKKVVFVHGCFWHGHGCQWGRLPQSNLDYWRPKIEANRERDARNVKALGQAGWRVLTIWQCELRARESALEKLCAFLDET
jgi:DNA mismatch endonuclease (patch repair protein)